MSGPLSARAFSITALWTWISFLGASTRVTSMPGTSLHPVTLSRRAEFAPASKSTAKTLETPLSRNCWHASLPDFKSSLPNHARTPVGLPSGAAMQLSHELIATTGMPRSIASCTGSHKISLFGIETMSPSTPFATA